MSPAELKALVRTIPDYPAKGIRFRDITPLMANGPAFRACIDGLGELFSGSAAAGIAGIEARGFVFGAAVAAHMRLPFIPIRKPGKLPCDVISVDYELEYGVDRLEMDPGAVATGQKIVIVDDLLATGGTACAATHLLRQAGAEVQIACFAIELPFLRGAQRLTKKGVSAAALMRFDGD